MAAKPSTKPTLPQMKPADLRTFHAALARWYKTHGRHDLPWRNTDDAYAIWISEVMLQQTQVATVRARFYEPFLKRFPTIEALANAPTDAVMKAWEGLGYYSRARNLHKAAQQLAAEAKESKKNRTAMPQQLDGLLALPGIGRNTAHAVLAFGYHQPVAILEANVKRVVARIFALESPTDEHLWQGADMLLNTAHPFDYNQAMMDLGSMLCTPKNPDCPHCPANSICIGKTAPEKYPTKKAKKVVPTREVLILVNQDAKGRLQLEQRNEKLLGGLWGFPQLPLTPAKTIGTVTHAYSHFKLIGYVQVRITSQLTGKWFRPSEIKELALSKLDHKVLALVEKHHTAQKKR